MRSTIVVLVTVFSVGCSGSHTYVSHPMNTFVKNAKGEVIEDRHYHNYVTLRDKDSLFHTNDSKNHIERCNVKIENPQTQEEYAYPFKGCHRESEVMSTSNASMSQQMVTPLTQAAIQGGAFTSGMYLLGKGIGKIGSGSNNGTTVHNNGSASADGGDANATADADASSQASQTQGQGQEQVQGQEQGQGQTQGQGIKNHWSGKPNHGGGHGHGNHGNHGGGHGYGKK
ncbi:MAG: hypothetical protein ACRCYM_00965 [Cetobacterium sp.]